jgi:hypothetical protein
MFSERNKLDPHYKLHPRLPSYPHFRCPRRVSISVPSDMTIRELDFLSLSDASSAVLRALSQESFT